MSGLYRNWLRLTVQAVWGLLCSLCAVSVGLAGEGHSHGGIPFETEIFIDSSACARCHDGLVDNEGTDISFVKIWDTTMMRFSFFDPFWRAKVQSELLRFPDLSSEIEDKCIRCHAPMASEQIMKDGSAYHLFGDGGLVDPVNDYYPMAMDGISCTLCHQVLSGEVDSGDYLISDTRVAFGPYDTDPDNAIMMDSASGYFPTYSAEQFISSSQFCATCHDLYTPYVTDSGDVVDGDGAFPEQTPYQEWLTSSYAAEGESCRDCHMARSGSSKISGLPRNLPERENVYAHTFLTENTMMLEMIASIAEDEGLEFSGLEDAVAAGKEYLAGAGEIEIKSAEWVSYDKKGKMNDLLVEVVVTNKTGHKMPTGIPVRRVFIHFAVYDAAGNIQFSSGDVGDDGSILGVDADIDPTLFEQHHDVIDSGDKVQVYEGIMGRYEGDESNVTYTLLRASHFKKDNRVLPSGAEVDTVPQVIKPAGMVVDDANFGDGRDTVTYVVPNLKRSGGGFFIEAELKDQTLSYRMIQDLKDLMEVEVDETGIIQTFLSEYEHHKVQYELIDRDEVVIEQ